MKSIKKRFDKNLLTLLELDVRWYTVLDVDYSYLQQNVSYSQPPVQLCCSTGADLVDPEHAAVSAPDQRETQAPSLWLGELHLHDATLQTENHNSALLSLHSFTNWVKFVFLHIVPNASV